MKKYHNVMELLVDQEVERQLNQLPVKLTQYINSSQVATYALNRLPPLYASNAKGWRRQKLRGEKKLQNHITTAVSQAFVAIQRDLIRRSTSLKQVQNTQNQEMPGRQESPSLEGQRDVVVSKITDASQKVLGSPHKMLSSRMSFSAQSLKTGLSNDRDADTYSMCCHVSPSRQPSPVKVTQQLNTKLSEPNDYWNDALYQR